MNAEQFATVVKIGAGFQDICYSIDVCSIHVKVIVSFDGITDKASLSGPAHS